MSYEKAIEAIDAAYRPKMREILSEVREQVLARGFVCDDIYDMSCEETRLTLLVQEKGAPEESGVDVTLIIAESNHYEGAGDGVNFMLDLIEYGGTVVGGVAPYNYTEDVWVDATDTEAVAKRWEVFTDCFDASLILDHLEVWFSKKAA